MIILFYHQNCPSHTIEPTLRADSLLFDLTSHGSTLSSLTIFEDLLSFLQQREEIELLSHPNHPKYLFVRQIHPSRNFAITPSWQILLFPFTMIHLDPSDGHPSPCDGDLFVFGSTSLHIVLFRQNQSMGRRCILLKMMVTTWDVPGWFTETGGASWAMILALDNLKQVVTAVSIA